MAIVPIKKIRLVTHRDDVSLALEVIQKIGAVEFKTVTEADDFIELSNVVEKNTDILLNKSNQAITFLEKFEKKPTTYEKLVRGSFIEINDSQLEVETLDEIKLTQVLDDVKSLQTKMLAIREEINNAIDKKQVFLPWQSLSVPLEFLNTKRTKTFLIKTSVNKKANAETLAVQLKRVLSESNIEGYVDEIGSNLVSLTIYTGVIEASSILQIVKLIGAEVVILPFGNDLVSAEIIKLEQQIKALELKLNEVNTEVTKFAEENLKALRIAHDAYHWKQDRYKVLDISKSSTRVVILEGWCVADKLDVIRDSFAKQNLLCNITEAPLLADEVPPVELKNSALVQPFEIVTKLNGLPSHKDLDPTPFMAVFFFLFFGLCLTDVGYGALLMLLAAPFIFYFKISKIAKQAGQLIFLMGFSTVIIGMFFGGYFGINMTLMPKFLQELQMFDPINNPLPVFYLALALGVIQVMTGMILRIVSEAKNGQLMTGLLDQGPWLFLFTSLILYGASSLEYIASGNSEKFLVLIYLSLATVVLASGRSGKTIFGKIQMSLLSIYNSIGYLSDVLSYSRLLALGLATSALAFAVNLIAGIVYEMIPYVGIILAVVILIIGHVFTLVINTLGSFIHSARLQFVEFFGKFITGTGKEFKPLIRKESFINVIKDSG